MGIFSKLFFKKEKEKPIESLSISDYVVVDVETTGFDPIKNDIIEIGAVKVCNNEVLEVFSELVKPKSKLSDKIIELTGITPEMLATAPSINKVLPRFLEFIGDSYIVGHNIDFDTKFISIACQRFKLPFNNYVIDTLAQSRKAFPEFPNHKLETICSILNIDNPQAHRALSDCLAEYNLYSLVKEMIPMAPIPQQRIELKRRFNVKSSENTLAMTELLDIVDEVIADNVITEDELFMLKHWLDYNSDLKGNFPFDRIEKTIDQILEDEVIEQSELDWLLELLKGISMPNLKVATTDEKIDLNGKNLCFTCDFIRGSEEEIQEELSESGAIIRKNVSGKTDYLVVGGYGSIEWSYNNYGNAYKAAMEYQDKGKNIIVISEKEFFDKCIVKKPLTV